MAFYSKIGTFRAIAGCSIGSAVLGIFLMIIGSIITGIAYTEITPPDWDDNYKRYIGSNLWRVLGPLFLGFGTILLLGSCCFFSYAFLSEARSSHQTNQFIYDSSLESNHEKMEN